MITNVSKNVICVKDIPSNIIEEAIFILKSDRETRKNDKLKINRKEIATREAEDFLKDYMDKMEREEIYEKEKNSLAKKILKIAIVAAGIILAGYLLMGAVIN